MGLRRGQVNVAGQWMCRRQTIVFAAVALIAIAAIVFLYHPETLLDQSTEITSTADWCLLPARYGSHNNIGLLEGGTYDWLSDRRVLFFLGVTPPRVNGRAVFPSHGGEPSVYDAVTRSRSP